MNIHHEETEQGVVVIHVVGRVMLGDESAQIEKLVGDLLAQGRKNIVFELSGVTHIDSTGIGRFIASLNRVMQSGGQMRMAAAAPIVREGFRVTRLDTVFQFFPDVASACEGFR
ncbi:MAG: STAS domain-containing protein [Bryobacteraceae bacterium]|nr:STAS domain-containing protein [Bryobacteraceae bacterium]